MKKTSKLLFKEEQKFGLMMKVIMLPGMIVTMILFGVGFYQQLYLGKPWGNNPISDTGLIILGISVMVVMILTFALISVMKLITEIRDDGIYLKFPPLINKFRVFKPESIERYEVRKYNAIREYGGYGIKGKRPGKNFRSKGYAYNVSGNTGLQLYLKDGKKVLIGTQRGEAIKYAMDKMMKKE